MPRLGEPSVHKAGAIYIHLPVHSSGAEFRVRPFQKYPFGVRFNRDVGALDRTNDVRRHRRPALL